MRFKRRPHTHFDFKWDKYYSHCSCGACSGDMSDPRTGLRYASFDSWPKEGIDNMKNPEKIITLNGEAYGLVGYDIQDGFITNVTYFDMNRRGVKVVIDYSYTVKGCQ